MRNDSWMIIEIAHPGSAVLTAHESVIHFVRLSGLDLDRFVQSFGVLGWNSNGPEWNCNGLGWIFNGPVWSFEVVD